MSKIIIVPDVHGRTFWRLAKEKINEIDRVVFLSVFSFIVAKNILPDSDNNQYYAKPNENMIAKIESITKENNKL